MTRPSDRTRPRAKPALTHEERTSQTKPEEIRRKKNRPEAKSAVSSRSPNSPAIKLLCWQITRGWQYLVLGQLLIPQVG